MISIEVNPRMSLLFANKLQAIIVDEDIRRTTLQLVCRYSRFDGLKWSV